MLARTYGPRFSQFPCYVQPKLDGVRALYQNGTFQSRDEKLWKPGVLKHLVDELATLNLGDTILDGEFYVHGWKLQRINGAVAVNRNAPIPDTLLVEYHVFDVVDPKTPFSQRWLGLYHGLTNVLLHVKTVPTVAVHTREDFLWHFDHYTALGYEGVMARPDGVYEFGEHIGRGGTPTQFRSKFLWKHKDWQDGEFLCVGTTPGEGKADIGIGALRCTTTGGHEFKVGTGLDDETRVAFAENPPFLQDIRVKYRFLTDDGIPFNPVFVAVMS